MKKSELAIVFFMLAFCGFFYHETLLLPEKAQHYPLFVISRPGGSVRAAAGQNADWLPRALFPSSAMLMSFEGFLASSICRLLPCVHPRFSWELYFIGFYLTAILYMGFMMHYFKIEKKYIVLTTAVLLALIYGVFSESLNVPLPVGELFYDIL